MGAWGYGILESDEAADFAYDMDLILDDKVKNLNKSEYMLKVLDKINTIGVKYEDNYGFEKAVAYQVLLVKILNAGIKVEQDIFTQIIQGVRGGEHALFEQVYNTNGVITEQDIPKDLDPEIKWYNKRMKVLTNLLILADNYDITGGTKIKISSKGLINTIFEKANKFSA